MKFEKKTFKQNKCVQVAYYHFLCPSEPWLNCVYLALKVAKQLKSVAPLVSRGIYYENIWRNSNYKKAIKYFNKHEKWTDRTRSQHARALAEMGQFDEAYAVVKQIENDGNRRGTFARLMYMQGMFHKLAIVNAQADEERMWQSVGLAEKNLKKAGKALVAIADNVTFEIPQLQVLVRYYSYLNNDVALEKYTRKLVTAVDKKVETLSKLANAAVTKKYIPKAQRLLKQLEVLSPSWDKLEELRKKVMALEEKEESAVA